MRRAIRIENTSRLCWFVLACCGSEVRAPSETPIIGGSLPASQAANAPANAPMSSVGGPAEVVVMRATAKITPLMPAQAMAVTMPATTISAGAGAGGRTSSAGAGGKVAVGSGGSSAFADGMGAGRPYAAGGGGTAGSSAGAVAGMGAFAPAGGAGGLSSGSMAPSTDPGGPPANIMGSASFVTTGTDVTFSMMVNGCRAGRAYPVHIYDGASCENAMTQGGQWDATRGDGIPNLVCAIGRQGMLLLVRDGTIDTSAAWSIGDGVATDIVGHTLVIHDGDDPSVRIACGVITKN